MINIVTTKPGGRLLAWLSIHGIMSNRKGGVLDEKGTGRVVIHSVNVDIEFLFIF